MVPAKRIHRRRAGGGDFKGFRLETKNAAAEGRQYAEFPQCETAAAPPGEIRKTVIHAKNISITRPPFRSARATVALRSSAPKSMYTRAPGRPGRPLPPEEVRGEIPDHGAQQSDISTFRAADLLKSSEIF